MSERYKTAADLVKRHMQYCFGEFSDGVQYGYEGDIPMLCHVAGISATEGDERYKGFVDFLMAAREANVEGVPREPLDINRLGAAAGGGEAFMDKIFGKDVEETADAIRCHDKLDLSIPSGRDELIERVLADTRAIVGPVAAWLATDENFRTGHFMAQPEFVYNFIDPQSPQFCVKFPTAEQLFDRINEVLKSHLLNPLPDHMAGPRHNVEGAGHLRMIPGGKDEPCP